MPPRRLGRRTSAKASGKRRRTKTKVTNDILELFQELQLYPSSSIASTSNSDCGGTTTSKMTLCTLSSAAVSTTTKAAAASSNGTADATVTSTTTSPVLSSWPNTEMVRARRTASNRPTTVSSGKRALNGSMLRGSLPAKMRSSLRRSLEPCENSNDSGLGFEHHAEQHQNHHLSSHPQILSTTILQPQSQNDNNNNTVNGTMPPSGRLNSHNNSNININNNCNSGTSKIPAAKRPKMDIKLEHDEINDGYSFPDSAFNYHRHDNSTSLIRTAPAATIPPLTVNANPGTTQGRVVPRCTPLTGRQVPNTPVTLTAQLNSTSRFLNVGLTIIKQPEQQHRARYQTEGSRGAVKDRDGNGFPVVQLTGYYQPTTLQVFIGTDVGKVAPHMFYQACKVSGKNSTPCSERKIDGTCVIELQLDPSKDMSATCDCVGILKERNVDVEHRFPDQLGARSKKKSTRCRMIFRTTLTHDDGSVETLQVCSQPIVCTQPPGVPEICKKSLTSCPASGGLELFVLGKNFLKDTKVVFQQIDDDRHILWEQSVSPDKEYLQQTHFVCVVPPYRRTEITEPVTVRLSVVSSGKTSESHQFVYTPINGAVLSGVHQHNSNSSVSASQLCSNTNSGNATNMLQQSALDGSGGILQAAQTQFFNKMLWSTTACAPINNNNTTNNATPTTNEHDLDIMPPPDSSTVPLSTSRRSSINNLGSAVSGAPDLLLNSPPLRLLKQEYIDENSQSSVIDQLEVRHRFRHISESSLDVHQGDSNSNSLDNNSNMSENSSATTTRRNSLSRHQFSDNSMDVNLGNSRLSILTNEDSICSSTNSSMPPLLQASPPDLKVMDLRMKSLPMVVSDVAALRTFGVTETSTLPTQSAQSVENFLTRIESAKIITVPEPPTAPTVFLTTKAPDAINPNNNIHNLVAKSEAATVAEQISNVVTVVAATGGTATTTTLINTEKLDAFVNSAVESHMVTGPTTLLNTDLCHPTPTLTVTAQAPHTAADLVSLTHPICQTTLTASILTTANPTHLLANTESEKAVLLNAAVDLLATTKQLSEMTTVPPTTKELQDLMVISNDTTTVSRDATTNNVNNTKSITNNTQFVDIGTSPKDLMVGGTVVVPSITIGGETKKVADDRMIPPSLTALTENELMNLINPSCFDQGNNPNSFA